MVTVRLVESDGPFLNSAKRGEESARQVVSLWRTGRVCLDFAGIEYITASFANALFFNLLDRCENRIDQFEQHVAILNASDAVQSAIDLSFRRHVREGIRLSRYINSDRLTESAV